MKNLGTIWTAKAKFQIINEDTFHWDTLIECMDTPNEITKAKSELKRKGYKSIWINSDVFGRNLITL